MLNPVHLRTLGVVLAAGSFADAARRLGYTPSAVSQQISTLERQLRLTLFERDAHAIRPTAAAQEVAERAVPALGALRALDEDLRMLAGGTIGRFRIASFPTASERLLPTALSALRRQRPRVEVELDEAEPQRSMRMLEAGEIDLALVYTYGTVAPRWARGSSLMPIVEEPLLLVSRPDRPHAPARPRPPLVGLADYESATWIATREDTQGAAAMDRLCRDSGFEPHIRYRSNNYGVLEGLVSSGLGVALVPALGLSETTTVVRQPLASPEARRRVSLVAAPSVPRDLTDVFLAALRRTAAKQHASSAASFPAPEWMRLAQLGDGR
jgi:DNA-binding transcriptional LysR family regulator